MAKVKMTTSANRDGVALPNGSEQDFPQEDAVSLCRAGLALPVGWELPQLEDGDDDVALNDASDEPPKKNRKKA